MIPPCRITKWFGKHKGGGGGQHTASSCCCACGAVLSFDGPVSIIQTTHPSTSLPFIHIWVMGELEPIPGDWARSAVHTCIGQLPIVGRIQTNNHSHLKWPVKCMASFWCLVRVKRQERFKYAQGWICYPFFLTLHRVTCGFPLTNVFTVYMLWGRKDKTLCHDVLRPWIE